MEVAEENFHSSELDIRYLIDVHARVAESGLYNFEGVRMPIPTHFNIDLWRHELTDYKDSIVCEYIEFGWPINYVATYEPRVPPTNHASAIRFAAKVEQYIREEVALGATMGPFSEVPFAPGTPAPVFSPLQTVPKDKGEPDGKRRVVMDLSYPDNISSVNAGIPKDKFLGSDYHLQYGSFDDFSALVVHQGQGCLLFKRDLSRAFRQIYVCPSAYHHLGYKWKGDMYFDLVFPFGLRSACVACQRTTDAIKFIYEKNGRKCTVFLDDFGSCARPEVAVEAFEELGMLLSDLGVDESLGKAWPPSTDMEFLGIGINTEDMICYITEKKMTNIVAVLDDFLENMDRPVTKRQLQSVAGKLHFLSKCCRPGRLFMGRLLTQINLLETWESRTLVSKECTLDMKWWRNLCSEYNGVSLLPNWAWGQPDDVFCMSVSRSGSGTTTQDFIGAYDRIHGRYIHGLVPMQVVTWDLPLYVVEMLAVVAIAKAWGATWGRLRISWACDHEKTQQAISSGKVKHVTAQACLRELWLLASMGSFELRAFHIPGIIGKPSHYLADVDKNVANFERFSQSIGDVPVQEFKLTSDHFKFSDM